jgi:Zn-dependent M28 family amino/carboxypeptidase
LKAPLSLARRTARVQDLFIVVQKGRLFQIEHPDVPVIVDKGRYLLVELTEAQAQEIKEHEEPCYTLRRFASNLVVFDAPGPSTARQASPLWVHKLVDAVHEASIRSGVEKLASFRTRYATSASYNQAATWVKGQLDTMGYSTQFATISVRGAVSHNVIASREGHGQGKRSQVLVTAHLDSINHQDGPAGKAPGADDNASGSAGVLEIARVLQDHPGIDDVTFILFGGEEQGLFGSKHYVASLSSEARARIKTVLNMDMIGNQNTAALTVLLEGSEVSRQAMEDLQDAAANHTSLAVQTSFDPHDSDHVPFIDAGIPAVLTIEGTDSANTAIHSARDTLDKVDFNLVTEILRMNVAFTALAMGNSVSPGART